MILNKLRQFWFAQGWFSMSQLIQSATMIALVTNTTASMASASQALPLPTIRTAIQKPNSAAFSVQQIQSHMEQANQKVVALQAEINRFQMLFRSHQFKTLETELNQLRVLYPSTATLNYDRLDGFYQGLCEQEGDFADILSNLQAWKIECPDSLTPYLIEASLYVHRAWKSRGKGFAYQVSESDAGQFESFMKASQNLIQNVEAHMLPLDAELYWLQLQQSFALTTTNANRIQAFRKGVAIDPEYGELYAQIGALLLPRWFGEPGELLAFANQQAKQQTDAAQASIVYARLAAAAITPRSTDRDVTEYGLPWPQIQDGFWRLLAQGKLTTENVHQFGWLAVAYRDRSTAKLLLEALGSKPGSVWQSKLNYRNAIQWAEGKKSTFTYQIPEALLKPKKQ